MTHSVDLTSLRGARRLRALLWCSSLALLAACGSADDAPDELAALAACPADDPCCGTPELTCYADADGDGVTGTAERYDCSSACPAGTTTTGTDCDDEDPTVSVRVTCYPDADRDGYGAGTGVTSCKATRTCDPGYSLSNSDCDDSSAAVSKRFSCYRDGDGDRYTVGSAVTQCLAPSATTCTAGYQSTRSSADDCDDTSAAKYVTASCYTDSDNDEYGTGAVMALCGATTSCGDRLASRAGDCNDADASKSKNLTCYQDADLDNYTLSQATVSCVAQTTSCSGQYDAARSSTTDCNDNNSTLYKSMTCYVDADGDGWGRDGSGTTQCTSGSCPAGSASKAGDCNDSAPSTSNVCVTQCAFDQAASSTACTACSAPGAIGCGGVCYDDLPLTVSCCNTSGVCTTSQSFSDNKSNYTYRCGTDPYECTSGGCTQLSPCVRTSVTPNVVECYNPNHYRCTASGAVAK